MFRCLSLFLSFSLIFLFFSCQNSDQEEPVDPVDDNDENPVEQPAAFFYKGADISYYPRIRTKNLTFLNRDGQPDAFLDILKDNGINTARLRLWHSPADEHASFEEVEAFSNELKALGLKVWLTVHYSDWWADPGSQVTPAAWQNADYETLKDSVYNYTYKIMSRITPDIIQIGNEVDPGFLHPIGHIQTNEHQFLGLLESGIRAVRDHNSETKIMIHKADPNSAMSFFTKVKNLDFDLMGLSYYPRWHGKDLGVLQSSMAELTRRFRQSLVLAETSYPFTLGWNDWHNNVIGSNDQIIYPDYPASFVGQQNYLQTVFDITKSINNCVGIGYWGAEWVAFNGPTATEGSPYENQALFDFDLQATPALEVFKN